MLRMLQLPDSRRLRQSTRPSTALEVPNYRALDKNNRIVTLDWECLPGHWIGADYTSRIVTALAWSWSDSPDRIDVMTHYDHTRTAMAEAFRMLCSGPGVIVTGHWITGFDLPVGNGARLRENLPPLEGSVLAWDTKSHLAKTSGRSLSQQNLAAS
jgi:hypothetical protein